VDRAHFFDRLCPLQDEVLQTLSAAGTGFYLSGALLTASRADWELIRWIEAPDPDVFLGDLRRLGEELALLPPPR
jgi:hypothetical protein